MEGGVELEGNQQLPMRSEQSGNRETKAFDRVMGDEDGIVRSVLENRLLKVGIYIHYEDLNSRQRQRDPRLISWQKPPSSWMKANFDGSLVQDGAGAGAGVDIRDCSDKL